MTSIFEYNQEEEERKLRAAERQGMMLDITKDMSQEPLIEKHAERHEQQRIPESMT